jgi:hypothetical protein
MLRLAALALVLGGLAAAALLLPLDGRTVADRWRAAPDARAFAVAAWDELRGAPAPPPRRAAAARPRAPERAAAPPRRAAPAATPTEGHTTDDRAALDRLVGERAR